MTCRGAKITPHYDSLLVKITAKARNRKDAAAKVSLFSSYFEFVGWIHNNGNVHEPLYFFTTSVD